MSLQKQTIVIEMLEDGFLVRRLNMDFRLAGLTTGRDLCEWIAKWSGAKVDIFEAYEAYEGAGSKAVDDPIPVKLADPVLAAPVEPCFEETPATPPQEPQESVAEAVAAEVPGEVESAPRKRTPANADALRADPDLTENQAAVLHHIERCAKPGERFQICMNTLAKHAGVSKGGVPFYLAKLKEAGFIDHEPPYGGDVFITRLKMEKAA